MSTYSKVNTRQSLRTSEEDAYDVEYSQDLERSVLHGWEQQDFKYGLLASIRQHKKPQDTDTIHLTHLETGSVRDCQGIC